MIPGGINKALESGCAPEGGAKEKLCRSRGGESCAFDGAMIVLQPVADCVHIVHGPSACCGNSWENRGSLSGKGTLHKMGFTTDMDEFDIVYGSEGKLYDVIIETCRAVRPRPRAAFVYSTCVSGLTGEDIDAVCRRAEANSGIKAVPVNAPGFIGPKNLGNRLAGEALLDHVIGTGEPPFSTDFDINLIGEYNIAGDLWLIEPLFEEAGIRVLSRITGNSSFDELTYSHRAKLNVVVCGRALINVAREMERRYGIPYVEVSFFGKTETAGALRAIAGAFHDRMLIETVENLIAREELKLPEALKECAFLKGKKAVLYTGGVKSWSFVSTLRDLGIEVVAIGTKKSSFEDEEKIKGLLGPDAPLCENTTPKNLLKLIREKNADMLIAGGRNQYLAAKEGIPFVDVNQERHVPYAGYRGLFNLACDIAGSMKFYDAPARKRAVSSPQIIKRTGKAVINPLKHSQSIGAAIAIQGIDRALPVIHGAQGCSFLAKVLLTRHFREPIALASTKLFTEDVVMGSGDVMAEAVKKAVSGGKERPDIVAVLSSGLTETKGDDIAADIGKLTGCGFTFTGPAKIIYVPTPDFEGGLETGYVKCVEELVRMGAANQADGSSLAGPGTEKEKYVNVFADWHHTPADFNEIREIIESFGLHPVMVPDLSALDGSRQGMSPLTSGGTPGAEMSKSGAAGLTLAIGLNMERAASLLKELCNVDYKLFPGLSLLEETDGLMETLSNLSGRPVPRKYERQRRILIDGMRDAHPYFINKKIGLALEPGLAVSVSRWIEEMGASVELAVIPQEAYFANEIRAKRVLTGDLFSIQGDFDLLIGSSHGRQTAEALGIPLYEAGFPVFGKIGHTAKLTVGYTGTLASINEAANLLADQPGPFVKSPP